MTKVASRFRLSDVGLAKACKRFDILRPSASYWAKSSMGKEPKCPTLQPGKDGTSEPITFLPEEKPKPHFSGDQLLAGGWIPHFAGMLGD